MPTYESNYDLEEIFAIRPEIRRYFDEFLNNPAGLQ
jgi:hypothetical protein